jgi:hypothetical protein
MKTLKQVADDHGLPVKQVRNWVALGHMRLGDDDQPASSTRPIRVGPVTEERIVRTIGMVRCGLAIPVAWAIACGDRTAAEAIRLAIM